MIFVMNLCYKCVTIAGKAEMLMENSFAGKAEMLMKSIFTYILNTHTHTPTHPQPTHPCAHPLHTKCLVQVQ